MAGHYIQNTGDEDLLFLEMFAAPDFKEIALNQQLRATPAQVTMAHTNPNLESATRQKAQSERQGATLADRIVKTATSHTQEMVRAMLEGVRLPEGGVAAKGLPQTCAIFRGARGKATSNRL